MVDRSSDISSASFFGCRRCRFRFRFDWLISSEATEEELCQSSELSCAECSSELVSSDSEELVMVMTGTILVGDTRALTRIKFFGVGM